MIARSFSKRQRPGRITPEANRQARGSRAGKVALVAIGLALLALAMLPVASNAAHSPHLSGGIAQGFPALPPEKGKAGAVAGPRSGQPFLNRGGQPVPFRTDHHARPDVRGFEAPSAITTTNWTNLWPTIWAVSAVSSDEAWAAAEYGHLLHYTGGAWNDVDPPNMHGDLIQDIKMLSPTDGWIAAYNDVFQYDGATWNTRDAGLTSSDIWSISPVASNDVWGVGGTETTSWRDTIMHWNGTTWSPAGPVLTDTAYLNDIGMAGASDGWAVGYSYSNSGGGMSPLIYRYNGSSWSQVPAPPGAAYLDTLSARVPGEVWIVGFDQSYTDTIYRYAAGSWSAYPTTDFYISDIFMLDSTHGWASTTDYGSILYWDGTSWTAQYTDTNIGSLSGISGANGRLWAVGGAETILTSTGNGTWTKQRGGPTGLDLEAVDALNANEAWAVGLDGVILHYTGTWQRIPSSLNDLYAVQALSPNEAYAAGSGVIAKWDGTTWTQLASPPAYLLSLDMIGSGEGWAVGDNGAIWHDSQGTWGQVPSPTTGTLYTVAMDTPTHGWAGGMLYGNRTFTPVLLEYDGTNWVDRSAVLPAGAPELIYSMFMTGPGEGWAGGEANSSDPNSRAVLQLSGGVWHLGDPGGQVFSGDSIAPDALGEVWAASCGAYHYVGGNWGYVDTPTSWCQNDISLVPGRGGWVVGPYGSILKYDPLSDGRTFYDVAPDSPFYTYINYLASHSIISGYADNTFRPGNNTTRGQLCKIVSLAEGWQLVNPANPSFSDVPRNDPFYSYIETAYSHGVISGYADGTFRPFNNVTRGQLSKIIVLSEGWQIDTSGGPHFSDVAVGSAFYTFVETAYNHAIISGYADATFRPQNNATRGQISKIVYNAITQP